VPTRSRTSDWLVRWAIPTLVPTSVVTGCKPLCLQVFDALFWDHSALILAFIVFFWNTARDGSKTCYTTLPFIPTALGTIPIVKPFRVRSPPQCVYSIIQYPRTDFLNWHSIITIAHIVLHKTSPTATITTLLAFCFPTRRSPFCLLALCIGYTLRLYRLYAFTQSLKPFSVTLFHSQSQSHLFVICSYSHLQPPARS